MKTLLALLLLIPSLSWGKDLTGTKLWCKHKIYIEKNGPVHTLYEFVSSEGVASHFVSKSGINTTFDTYEVHTGFLEIIDGIGLPDLIDRKTLESDLLTCEIIEVEDSLDYVKKYFIEEFESKNKI